MVRSAMATFWSIMVLLAALCAVSAAVDLPTAWPKGTYAIPMPESGCPNTHMYWRTGRRYQDTQDIFANNQWSDPLHLEGQRSRTAVEQNFCVKTENSPGENDPEWGKGQYCIFKKGRLCPNRFSEGWIKWDDQNLANRNDWSGELPEGVYDRNTKIYFCCREDGDPGTPLELPVDEPFFLLRKNGECQSVNRMTMLEEWFRWDGEDDLIDWTRYRDGNVPDLESTGDNHKLMYCYYY